MKERVQLSANANLLVWLTRSTHNDSRQLFGVNKGDVEKGLCCVCPYLREDQLLVGLLSHFYVWVLNLSEDLTETNVPFVGLQQEGLCWVMVSC